MASSALLCIIQMLFIDSCFNSSFRALFLRSTCRNVRKLVAKSENYLPHFCPFARPSVGLVARMKQLNPYHIAFRENLYFWLLLQFDSSSKFWLKSDKNNRHFT
jgi:hypothetical protein